MLSQVLPVGAPKRYRFWDVGGDRQERTWIGPGLDVAKVVSDGRLIIEDIKRVQATHGDVNRLIRQTAPMDGHAVVIRRSRPGAADAPPVPAGGKTTNAIVSAWPQSEPAWAFEGSAWVVKAALIFGPHHDIAQRLWSKSDYSLLR